MGIVAWNGGISRRKTTMLNLRCLIAYPFSENASGVNSEEKSAGVRKAVRCCNVPATPATLLVSICTDLHRTYGPTNSVEKGDLLVFHTTPPWLAPARGRIIHSKHQLTVVYYSVCVCVLNFIYCLCYERHVIVSLFLICFVFLVVHTKN